MGKKSKVSYEEKIRVIEYYTKGLMSASEIAEKLSISDKTFYTWLKSYEANGAKSLDSHNKNKIYSKELKLSAVEEYLAGNGSYQYISNKYGLKSSTQLKVWIKKYNGHEIIKSYKSGGSLMTKGRSTTFDEKVEIVNYCIEHNLDYIATAKKYEVSYQQVYSWVKKYTTLGVEALTDKRGKRKLESEMSELEKLKAQNKLLKTENRKKQMEIDFLKKLEEIERGRS